MARTSFAALAALAVFFFSAFAAADGDHGESRGSTTLALDLEHAWPHNQAGVSGGNGGAVRLGRKANLAVVSLTGEIGGSYHSFSGSPDVSATRGFVGGRLALGQGLEPGVYGHLGIGRLNVDPGESRTEPTFDAGLFLDLTILPLVDLGVHAGYDTILGKNDTPAFDYYVAGAHAALVF